MNADSELLRFHQVDRTLGRVKALSGLDLAISAREFVILTDSDGLGRACALRLAAGLDRPDAGRVTFAGDAIGPAARARIGVALPDVTLPLAATLVAGLGFSARLYGLTGADTRAHIAEVLGKWGLEEHAHDRVASLSIWDHRRAELARATLHRPDLLVLGEMASGLAASDAGAFLAETRKNAAADRQAVLWATGDASAIDTGDRIVVLRRGSVAFSGSRKSLLARSKEKDIAAAIAAFAEDTADQAR
jgi:ABC-2 type transport system ATP-binding protein